MARDHSGSPSRYPARMGAGPSMAHITPVLLSCSCDGAAVDALPMHFLKPPRLSEGFNSRDIF